MRDDVNEAIEVALGENLADGRFVPRHIAITPTRRGAFLARLRLFLKHCPDDLTIDELRDEVGV